MIYNLIIKNRVFKALDKIREPDYTRIKTAMFDLANTPRPMDAKNLKTYLVIGLGLAIIG